jgi:hypothetical protein
MKLMENDRKRKEMFVSKCRVWKLKEADVSLWNNVKKNLLEAADDICGRTKNPPRHRETW